MKNQELKNLLQIELKLFTLIKFGKLTNEEKEQLKEAMKNIRERINKIKRE